MVIVRVRLGRCRRDGAALHLQEPAASSMVWQSPRRRSSEILKLGMGEMTAVGDDPKSDGMVNSCRGQSLFPAVVDSPVTELQLVWRS
jgi:hypothetical protein